MARTANDSDVAVVGGGLSGLTTACFLARAGYAVRLFEKGESLGGRASTDAVEGFLLNRGPHALYRTGEATRILAELSIPYTAGAAPTNGWALSAGRLHRLPVGPGSLVSTGLMGWGAKMEAARWLSAVPKLRAEDFDGVSVRQWLERNAASDDLAGLFQAFVRVSTYANAPASFSAGTAILQLQKALSGVSYVDGGWQSLIGGLAQRARDFGGQILCSSRVESFCSSRSGFVVRLSDGREARCRAVVLATPRRTAERLLESAGAAPARDTAEPIRMATLDIGLARVPMPAQRFVLGIDRPLYLSVHSGVARLGDRGAVLHVAKYLPGGDSEPAGDRAEIEALLDVAQPGWRNELVAARFLPRLTVAERLDTARDGGRRGRPNFAVAGLPGAFIAGDWVRGGSWLADAAMGSAREVALAVSSELLREKAVA